MTIAERKARAAYDRENPWLSISTAQPSGMICELRGATSADPSIRRGEVLSERRRRMVSDRARPPHVSIWVDGISPDRLHAQPRPPALCDPPCASLENGLLAIELAREIPEEMKPRRVAISSATSFEGKPEQINQDIKSQHKAS